MPSEYHYRGAKRARKARDELGLGQDGRLEDILTTVEGVGAASVAILDLPEDVAGAYIKRPDLPLLVIGGADHIARQRFTLAHEFGHFRMGHEAIVDRQITMTGYTHDPCEVEANAFAAEFLVPKQAMLAWAAGRRRRSKVTLEDVVSLAWEYGVSTQMMRYRLETCELVTDRQLCDRLDQEIGEGLGRDLAERLGLEPLEDSLVEEGQRRPRIPYAIRDTMFGDLLAGLVTVDHAAARLGCPIDDVRQMLVSAGLEDVVPAPAG